MTKSKKTSTPIATEPVYALKILQPKNTNIEQQHLYQAIVDNPHDLTPRLVYADFLDELGTEYNICPNCDGNPHRSFSSKDKIGPMWKCDHVGHILSHDLTDLTRTYECAQCNTTGYISNNINSDLAELIRLQVGRANRRTIHLDKFEFISPVMDSVRVMVGYVDKSTILPDPVVYSVGKLFSEVIREDQRVYLSYLDHRNTLQTTYPVSWCLRLVDSSRDTTRVKVEFCKLPDPGLDRETELLNTTYIYSNDGRSICKVTNAEVWATMARRFIRYSANSIGWSSMTIHGGFLEKVVMTGEDWDADANKDADTDGSKVPLHRLYPITEVTITSIPQSWLQTVWTEPLETSIINSSAVLKDRKKRLQNSLEIQYPGIKFNLPEQLETYLVNDDHSEDPYIDDDITDVYDDGDRMYDYEADDR